MATRQRRTSTGPSSATRNVVLARARFTCEPCGANLMKGGGQFHHRRPRQMGGSSRVDTNAVSNLLFVCVACHDLIEQHRTVAYDLGLLVRRGVPPTDVPVQLFIPRVAGHDLPALCRVFLTDDGRYLLAEAVTA